MSNAKTQSGLFDEPRPGSNLPEYGVSELSKLLKKTVEDSYGLVRVRGEISECKYHSSGHVYLTLKDEGAVLASVCWRGQVGKLSVKPEVGMEVVCTGRLTTYPGQSKYQLVIDGMALAGIGALLKMLEERKKKLAAEGLFLESRKQELPFFPNVIGVITSPTGAVIRDILHRIQDRFPCHVLIWPVAVQGPGAPEQIASAIHGFNHLPPGVPQPDVLIVARGGGSVEDLMAFNEEIVVRAAAASHIALISAVGHETDTTLIDFAADVRAPTPTGAAEMAVPVRAALMAQLGDEGMRLWHLMRRTIVEGRERLALTSRALGDPARVMEPLMQRLDERAERLRLAGGSLIERRLSSVRELGSRLPHPRQSLALAGQRLMEQSARIRAGLFGLLERREATLKELHARLRPPGDRLRLAGQSLQSLGDRRDAGYRAVLLRQENRLAAASVALLHLSPKAVLGRGYALVQNEHGTLVTGRGDVKPNQQVRIEFHDGVRGAVIDGD